MKTVPLRSTCLALCFMAIVAMGDTHAKQKRPGNSEPKERTEAQRKKKEKKQRKNAGRRAEKEFMKQMQAGEPTTAQLAEYLRCDASRIGATIDHPSSLGVAIIRKLEQMPPEKRTKEVLPALEKQFMAMLKEDVESPTMVSLSSDSPGNQIMISGRFLNMVNALAAIGPDGHRVLAKALGHNPALDLLITRKLGDEARLAAKGLIEDPTNVEWYWLGYYAAVSAGPDIDAVPILLRKMKEDDKDYGKYIRMVLDSIGPACVPQVAATLTGPDWFARFSAARTLEMMGPKAKAALPALEKTFDNTAEDVDVRVAAARAIARIKGIDEWALYKRIPDLERKLQESTRTKSLSWRKTYLKREGGRSADGIQGWSLSAWLVAAFTSGQNLDKANEILLDWLTTREEFGSTDGNNIWIFMACHSRSKKYPGRLKPDTEAAFKKFFFKRLNAQSGRQGTCPNTEFLTSAPKKMNLMSFNDDVPLDEQIRDYLAISVLKDDPAYRDKKLAAGDTVQERYKAFHGFFREALRHWALYGIQYQVGSSAYTYKTYPHYFNLIDFAPDPIVRKRARMFTDIVLVESAQTSISGLRGGSKGRAKRGGLGDRWDPYQAMLYGERGSTFFLTMPADSSYQVPTPALLLRKLGKTIKTYEIINDRPTGGGGKEVGFYKDCKAINYAWCTPEYVAGCGMYDPNGPRSNGAMGRWSGVIFRNLAAISLDAYTGEKWNVQHKDVRITQLCSDGPYVPGDTRIAFEALPGKVSEKDGWVFVNNDEAYAAVRVVSGGYFWMDSIRRLLYLKDIYSPIIIQTGRAHDYGSFAEFQAAIVKARLTYGDGKLEYRGPQSARLEFFPMTPQELKAGKEYTLPRINGKTIDLNPVYAYSSPYLQNRAGSSIVTLLYGRRKWEYDFETNTIREVSK